MVRSVGALPDPDAGVGTARSPSKIQFFRSLIFKMLALRGMSFNLMPDSQALQVLVGIMTTLSITSGIRVLSPGSPEIGELILTALATNMAWGVVDGVFHLFSTHVERRRTCRMVASFCRTDHPQERRQALAALAPPELVDLLDERQISDCQRVMAPQAHGQSAWHLQWSDVLMAFRIGLLLLLSTVPTALPMLLVDDPLTAFRWSQAVSVGIMFALGIPVARWTGVQPWIGGLVFALLGATITVVCISLGG